MSHTIARALPFWDFFYLFVLSRAGTGKMENRYTSFNLLPHVRKSLVDFPLSPHKKSKSARKKSLQKKNDWRRSSFEMPNQPRGHPYSIMSEGGVPKIKILALGNTNCGQRVKEARKSTQKILFHLWMSPKTDIKS